MVEEFENLVTTLQDNVGVTMLVIAAIIIIGVIAWGYIRSGIVLGAIKSYERENPLPKQQVIQKN
jgi:hypothetical protein